MPQKSPFKWFQEGPPKRHFLTPKMSFSWFSNFDPCRGSRSLGTLGSQKQATKKWPKDNMSGLRPFAYLLLRHSDCCGWATLRLKLQDIWLSKFISWGLLVPVGRLVDALEFIRGLRKPLLAPKGRRLPKAPSTAWVLHLYPVHA